MSNKTYSVPSEVIEKFLDLQQTVASSRSVNSLSCQSYNAMQNILSSLAQILASVDVLAKDEYLYDSAAVAFDAINNICSRIRLDITNNDVDFADVENHLATPWMKHHFGSTALEHHLDATPAETSYDKFTTLLWQWDINHLVTVELPHYDSMRLRRMCVLLNSIIDNNSFPMNPLIIVSTEHQSTKNDCFTIEDMLDLLEDLFKDDFISEKDYDHYRKSFDLLYRDR